MRITERLNVEHAIFLRQLDHLNDLVRRRTPPETWAAVAQAISYALAEHNRLEERRLYPALREVLSPLVVEVHVLAGEHLELDRLARRICGRACDAPSVEAFCDLLRAHIEKETYVLFPMAEEVIPDGVLQRMCPERAVLPIGRVQPQPSEWPERWLG